MRNKAKKKVYDAARYLENRDSRLAYQRKWTAANKSKIRKYRETRKEADAAYRKARAVERSAYSKAWVAANPERNTATRRRREGLPEPLRPASKLCECCGYLPGKQAMNLDHCHVTGAFRGRLCSKCNSAIGLLGDDEKGVLRALAYLQKATGASR